MASKILMAGAAVAVMGTCMLIGIGIATATRSGPGAFLSVAIGAPSIGLAGFMAWAYRSRRAALRLEGEKLVLEDHEIVELVDGVIGHLGLKYELGVSGHRRLLDGKRARVGVTLEEPADRGLRRAYARIISAHLERAGIARGDLEVTVKSPRA